MNKKGIEMSFAWIFAILAGAIILFTAIYGTINLITGGQHGVNAFCAKQITNQFDPMEPGLASGMSVVMNMSIESKIYNSCYSGGDFGEARLACSERSGIGKEWPPKGSDITIRNRYIFSDKIEQGKGFYLFSMPIELGFKIGEEIVMTSKTYCFESAPDSMKSDVKRLQIGSIKTENCTDTDVNVCFGEENAGCNVSVYGLCTDSSCSGEYDYGYTARDGKTVYWTGNLVYGSIFSDSDIYKCNFERLMLRLQKLVDLYNSEQAFLATKGCGTSMSSSLVALKQAASSADGTNLAGIDSLRAASADVGLENSRQGECRLWN